MVFGETLFELSWEVCNKVGGIYTVITSKLKEAKYQFKDYYLVGPYNKSNQYSFVSKSTPKKYEKAVEELEKLGIKLHFGEWLIDTTPSVILVEYKNYSKYINDIKARLYELHKIDSMGTAWFDFDEPTLWSWACGVAIEKLTQNEQDSEKKVLVHSHEWMAGGAIFYLKSLENAYKFKTVFTTHATMLGRTINYNEHNLYEKLESINPDEKAYEFKVHTKFQAERALAHITDIFTTVSNITDLECEKFFNRKADVILYNGFNIEKNKEFSTQIKEFEKSRLKLNQFVEGYFYNSYPILTQNTQIFFTSGRYEFENKGYKILVRALSKLNEKLKEENSSKNIVCFFSVMLSNNLEKDPQIIDSFKKAYNKQDFKTKDFAPLSTHIIESNNELIQEFIKEGLHNRKDDKVRVILTPHQINENDGVFNQNYYELVSGTDLAVFTSSYEPWGYTPLESISLGVPTITSNLAGFGRFIEEKKLENSGIQILDRFKTQFDNEIENLTQMLLDFTKTPQLKLIEQKKQCLWLSNNFTWEEFYNNYIKAYRQALEK